MTSILMMSRPILTALLATAVAAAAVGCSGSVDGAGSAGTPTAGAQTRSKGKRPGGGEDRSRSDAIHVQVGKVQRRDLSSLYSTSATLRAERQATITARTRGVVRRLLVEEGDRVRSGQALAELENEEQTIAFDRARASEETLSRDFERSRSLHEEGLVSDEVYEAVRREAQDAKQAAALAELELSRTVIRAPFDGIIVLRHLDVGATVSDGTQVYDLADVDPLYADVDVPERHVVKLSPGNEVRLSADAAGAQFPAVIERIAPSVDPATGTVKVTLAVPKAGAIRPGAFVRVDIIVDTHADALVVPRQALVAEGSRWHLFRLVDDATVQRLEVALGYEEGDRVEVAGVLAGEPIDEGTPVIVAGAPALTDGAVVLVVEEDGGPAAGDDGGAS